MKFEFVEEKANGYSAKIKVIGIGGAGGNAINNMISAKLRGVDFVTANTDSQDLERSACSSKVQLGSELTRGLGAGSDPEIGQAAAEESVNDIRESAEGADMVFITAGMGGGTGTGAAPVVARECREAGSLTVAVVTKPFKFEGDKRMRRALEGVENLKQEVDTLIIIPNERLKSVGTKTSTVKELFVRADEVLMNAVRGISDLINSTGFMNLDFADVKKVMAQMGTAIMGTGRAGGEGRAMEAAREAINSPLLEDISISGARGLLMNLTGPSDMTMEEVDEAFTYVKGEVDEGAEIFSGLVFDESMGDEVQMTVIATGIDREQYSKVIRLGDRLTERSGGLRDASAEEAGEAWTVRTGTGSAFSGNDLDDDNLDIPAFMRAKVEENPFGDIHEEEQEEKKGFFRRAFSRESLDFPTFLRTKQSKAY
ncbi:MAG: cell division protein FtsZ [Thermodesulfobacteriota bacterium]